MTEIYRRFESIQKTIDSRIERNSYDLDAKYYVLPGEGYKTDNKLPKNVEWKDFKDFSSRDKENDRHIWIKSHVKLPKEYIGKPLYLVMKDYTLSVGSQAPKPRVSRRRSERAYSYRTGCCSYLQRCYYRRSGGVRLS